MSLQQDRETFSPSVQSANVEDLVVRARRSRLSRGTGDVPHHIRVKNRRKRYLELHPGYFGSALELADPLLYDRLVRRFQSASERESEGRKKGYSGVLEADLYRGEAKLNALRNPDPNAGITYRRGQNGEILEEERDEIPTSKEEGMQRWREEMERRFLEGRDTDFDYETVDEGSEFDNVKEEERGAEEVWFEDESPGWVEEVVKSTAGDGSESGQLKLRGETGIQDF